MLIYRHVLHDAVLHGCKQARRLKASSRAPQPTIIVDDPTQPMEKGGRVNAHTRALMKTSTSGSLHSGPLFVYIDRIFGL